ncbi:DEAD/DEAH box helicase [Brochothrix thermosphacta]|uniref:DEAD/DEAH box helicase n=1 Tax=Brochothrix thermosphacta TaxID=2756 RepID=UPI00083F97C7|nr:DEAD/DEAH box helicase [Brochothrix thermosphacta]ATH86511.1 hypothetical protein CPF12_12360 [Brochothrix thermosphacta]MPQ28440.1 hypothetical protein [Brochothrix thermosphacta]ODJ64537.1 hypothetical protein BFR36_10630 [Brochothrix thermosphacta]ODJ70435.1 hypothetical protein BFR39_06630 [Brochothrix thermosphacta]ODJ73803.1 hypothetical protein BFR45_08385 [Brochothrix thermosphacta]
MLSITHMRQDKEHDMIMATVKDTRVSYIVSAFHLNEKDPTYRCECREYESDPKTGCVHINKVIDELVQQKVIKPRPKNTTVSLINDFASDLAEDTYHYDFEKTERTPYELTYMLMPLFVSEADRKIAISLQIGKVGQTHYVIKDIRAFLKAWENDTYYIVNPRLTIEFKDILFSKAHQQILTDLSELARMARIYDTNDWSRTYAEEKQLTLTSEMMVRILKQMPMQLASFTYQDVSYPVQGFYENTKVPITLNHQFVEEGISFDFQEFEQLLLFEQEQLVFFDGSFYHFSEHTIKPFTIIKKWLKKTEETVHFVLQEDYSNFFSYILTSLEKITLIQLPEFEEMEVVHHPIHTVIEIAVIDNEHRLQVTHYYNDFGYNPFFDRWTPELSGEALFIRDTYAEHAVMRILEQAPLHVKKNTVLVSAKASERYVFYKYIVPLLREHAEIVMDESLENIITEMPVETYFNEDSQDGYVNFSVQFKDFEGDHSKSLIEHILEGELVYEDEEGRLISLESEEALALHALLRKMRIKPADWQQNQLRLSIYRALPLMQNRETQIHITDQLHDLMILMQSGDWDLEKVSEKLTGGTLQPHQIEGYSWLSLLSQYGLNGILADEMGLGKTIQTIAYICSLLDKYESFEPTLIVCPSSVVYNWQNEWSKFAPEIKAQIIDGNKVKRQEAIAEMKENQIYITSYAMLREDLQEYRQHHLGCFVLDEAQSLKNSRSLISQAAKHVKAKHKVALSGTPIENRSDDLWALFQIILPGYLPVLTQFKKLPPAEVKKLTAPFILRRLKQDILSDLPSLNETNLSIDLNSEQKRIYMQVINSLRVSLEEDKSEPQQRMQILAALTRLRQICDDPRLILEDYQGGSAKLDELLRIVTETAAEDKQMLIFSQFASMLPLIGQELEKLGIPYFLLDGKTNASKRMEMATAFNNSERTVFLISLKAGGTGLNLTGASRVILYDLWWNPAVEQQAAARAHRIGQTKDVDVVRIISKGTIEENIRDLQQSKLSLVDQILPSNEQKANININELKQLLFNTDKLS